MTVKMNLCYICAHDVEGGKRKACDAFPQGIPRDIIMMRYDHRIPYPGDGGITFTLDRRKAKELLDEETRKEMGLDF